MNIKTNQSSFKNLLVWKYGHQLVLSIYKITNSFPNTETFGLTNQIRRASVSITSNLVEGYSKPSIKDKLNFFYISLGSLKEVENQILIAKDLNYINLQTHSNVQQQINKVGQLLYGLIKKYQQEIK